MSKPGSKGTAADLIIPPHVKGPPFEADEPGPPATVQSAATYIGKDKIATEAEAIRRVSLFHCLRYFLGCLLSVSLCSTWAR